MNKFCVMKKLILMGFALVSTVLCFGQYFPFPVAETKGYEYPYGIVVSNPDVAKIQSKFVSWNRNMYRESADGKYGRIRFDEEKYTVSEGIGYGMLIYVYMANETNDFCQDHFDKLYAYYQKWSNGNGLMNWKIQEFESINSYNAATDADLDVALALCLAAKQWGHSSEYVYAEEAEKLLKAIYAKEVGTHTVDGKDLTVFNPGDSWNSIANACYFTVASVGVFDQAQSEFDFSEKRDWKKVYDDSHTFLEKSQRAGLWPNWSNWNGTPAVRGNDASSPDYGWDACRTPWRVAWDYLWYGTESSKSMMDKTVAMMKAQNIMEDPSKAGYYSNLAADDYDALVYKNSGGQSAFVGGYACALMGDATLLGNLDIYYERLKKNTESPYYSPTLQVLYLLVASGNAANFFDMEGGAQQIVVNPIVSSASTDGTTLELSCSKSLAETITDYSGFSLYVGGKLQENAFSDMTISGATISLNLSNVEITQGTGVSISYNGDAIKSVQGGVLGNMIKYPVENQVFEIGGNTILADCEDGILTLLGGNWYSYSDGTTQSYKMLPGGANDTDTAVNFTYAFAEDKTGWVGVGFNNLAAETPLNCTGSTGFSFYHKGDACILETKTVTKKNANFSYHTYDIEAHEDWTLIELTWEEVADDFVTSGYVTEVTGFQWRESSGVGEFWIDEVTLIGRNISVSASDRTYLEASLVTSNVMYAKATTEKYPQSAIDAFVEAINVAADVYADSEATRDEIDEANATLVEAISVFQNAAYGDKTSLSKLIKKAEKMLDDAVVGEAKGNYPQSAKDALTAAVEVAQTSYETFGLTVPEVKKAVDELSAAIAIFENTVIKTDIPSIAIETKIYPNPCVDDIEIVSSVTVRKISISGAFGVIKKYVVNSSNVRLDVSALPTGIYFVQIVAEDGSVAVRKIVKM